MPHVRLPAADVTPGDSPSAIPPGKPGIGSDLDATVTQIGAVGLVVTSIVSNTAGYTLFSVQPLGGAAAYTISA